MQRLDDTAASAMKRHGKSAGGAFGWMTGNSQNLAEVAHDARNMVTALGLYCDLLEEPGVLSPSFRHYGGELKLLASASRHLVDKLMALNTTSVASGEDRTPGRLGDRWERTQQGIPGDGWAPFSGTPIRDLAFEMETNRNLLSALAGPGIELNLEVEGCALPVAMSSEDLTRILVNLVKNAVEAMSGGGRLQLSLRETPASPGDAPWLLLTVADNGPGILPGLLEQVFEPGYSTRSKTAAWQRGWQGDHLGLGLSITRSIVEAAGGRVHAASRDPSGACFQIELPVRVR